MALEGVDASIPLRAGQNLPQFGPDYNAIAEMQRTAIAMQNAKRVQASQNALQALYSDPNNFDAKTLQPTANAMAQLAQRSAPMAMDLANNIAAIQEKNAKLAYQQSEVSQQKQAEAQTLRLNYINALDGNLKAGMPEPEARARAIQDVWAPGIAALKLGMAPSMAATIPSSPDDATVRRNAAAYVSPKVAEKYAEIAPEAAKAAAVQSATSPGRIAEKEAERAGEFTTKTDPLKNVEYRQYKDGHTTDLAGNPFTPSGVGTAKPEKPMLAETVDGKPINVTQTVTGGLKDALTGEPIDPKTIKPGSLKPLSAKGEAGGEVALSGDPTKSGKEYLATLPQQEANQVNLMVEGKLPPPSSFALAKPEMRKLLAEAAQVDPNFDETTWGKRYQTIKSYSGGGKDDAAIQATNRAIGHAADLAKNAKDLNNFGGIFTPVNQLDRIFAQWHGDPRYKVYAQTAHALAEEMERAFRGTGGNLESLKKWEESFNSADSPAAMDASIANAMELLAKQVSVKREDYDRVMGPQANFTQYMLPVARKALDSVPGGDQVKEAAGLTSSGGMQPTGNQTGQTVPVATAVPDWAAAALKQHPERRDEFDKKFGAGAAAKVLGQ